MIRRWGSGGSGWRPPRTEIEKRGKYMSRSTSIVSATALTVALLWNLPAQAQDASPAPAGTVAPPDAEITVTGTRIQRDGYQAPTPLTVLGAEDIEASAPAKIGRASRRERVCPYG